MGQLVRLSDLEERDIIASKGDDLSAGREKRQLSPLEMVQQEFLETEETYVEGLRTIVKVRCLC